MRRMRREYEENMEEFYFVVKLSKEVFLKEFLVKYIV